MRLSGLALLASCLSLFGSTACGLPFTSVPPTLTLRPSQKHTSTPRPPAAASPTSQVAALPAAPSVTPTSVSASPPAPEAPSSFCADNQASVLIGSFRSAVLTSNGPLLSSLVSPAHGMDARLFRNGRVVNYDAEHAKFLFASNFVVDWGLAPGSGLDTRGSFHELLLPALADVFNRNYTLSCNRVQVGGTTYQATWPYPGVDFYSAYYPGTEANGNLDWHTWLLGVDHAGGKPYLYAIVQFLWEP
jgi:hypothetical protein